MRTAAKKKFAAILESVLAREPERDPGFREEILRLAKRSLYIIGAVEIGLPFVGLPVGAFVQSHPTVPQPPSEEFRFVYLAAFVTLGGLTIATASTRRGAEHARGLAFASGLGSAAILIATYLHGAYSTEGLAAAWQPAVELGVNLIFVQLVGVAVLPLRPIQMFLFGSSIVLLCFFAFAFSFGWAPAAEAFAHNHALHGLPIATVLTTALSAVIYVRVFATYRSHRQAMGAQSKLLLAENAASMGRLMAALSHELNTPAGALKSVMSTLNSVVERKTAATAEQRSKLEATEAELRSTAQQSTDRLQEVVARMQRFTGLDRAEIVSLDLNELVRDVASVLQAELSQDVRIDLDLQPLPPIAARPQQMSAVFSNLLHHAIGQSQSNRVVRLATRQVEAGIEVQVESNGLRMSPEDLSHAFDLGFEVRDERVGAANWSLFSARQIVREHGGDIRLQSDRDRGTKLSVVLPC